MKGNFRWERDTENYRRYCSEIKDPATGKFRVVYIPKSVGGDMPNRIEGMIVSDSDYGIQCCERDNNWDGNCDMHSAPGVLRQGAALDAGRRLHERLEEHYRGAYESRPSRFFNDSLHFDWRGTETGRLGYPRMFPPRFASYEGHNELEARVTKLEERQSILFQAVEKIIKLIGWRPGKRVKKIVPPGTYDAEIISVEQKGRFMTVDMEIKRTS